MARSTFKVLFWMNGSKEKNGLALDNIKVQIIKHDQLLSLYL